MSIAAPNDSDTFVVVLARRTPAEIERTTRAVIERLHGYNARSTADSHAAVAEIAAIARDGELDYRLADLMARAHAELTDAARAAWQARAS